MSNFATDDTSTDNPVQSHHSGDLHCEAHSQAENKEQSPRDAIELLPDEEVQDLPPLPPATDSEYSEDEEWDETPTALQLRALFTLLAGGFLLWSQLRAGFRPGAEWNRWVALSFVANLALPLGIVWLFFAQGVGYVSELKNQGLNAWNYGWNFRDWKTHVKWTLGMFVLMLPALWFAAQDATARDYYAIYFPSAQNVSLPWLLLSLVVYMFCWEWFFRGFLLFGLAQGVGGIVAVLLQALLFGWAHAGKPPLEFYSSFVGGLILGTLAWRQKSFAVAFYTHALLHVAWALLVR
jgi:membrane protease YdiL (CAAX protease family)